jgi:hypothetical protein
MGIILLLLLSSITPFQAAADVFCDNVKVAAATLVNKTSSSPTHFATTTFGHAPDVVYALALCRGDIVDDSTCADSVIPQNAEPYAIWSGVLQGLLLQLRLHLDLQRP